jgi:hypothetical protein
MIGKAEDEDLHTKMALKMKTSMSRRPRRRRPPHHEGLGRKDLRVGKALKMKTSAPRRLKDKTSVPKRPQR